MDNHLFSNPFKEMLSTGLQNNVIPLKTWKLDNTNPSMYIQHISLNSPKWEVKCSPNFSIKISRYCYIPIYFNYIDSHLYFPKYTAFKITINKRNYYRTKSPAYKILYNAIQFQYFFCYRNQIESKLNKLLITIGLYAPIAPYI